MFAPRFGYLGSTITRDLFCVSSCSSLKNHPRILILTSVETQKKILISTSFLFLAFYVCLHLPSAAVKTLTKNNLEEERVYFLLESTVLYVGTTRQELKQRSCSNAVYCLVLMVCSGLYKAGYLYRDGITHRGQPLPHQSLI